MPLVVSLLEACGGPVATFENGTYHGPGVSFGVGEVPSSWRRVDVDDAAVAFRDDRGSSVLVDGRCNVHSDDIPLVALTNQLLLGTTDRDYVKEETIPLDKREARHTVLRAKLDGVERVWDLYVMKKNGCVYDAVLVAPPDHFDETSATFDHFAMGLHTVGDASP